MFAILAQIAPGEVVPEFIPHPPQGEEVVVYLLLLLLAAVIVLGAVCFVLILHFIRQRRREPETPPESPAIPTLPQVAWRNAGILLVPARWMAVRAASVREVRNALELSNTTPCSIEDGLAGNHQQALFLAPPVNGWVLITGPGVPDPAGDIDEVFHVLRALSIRLGAAQFFCFNRALGYHGWAWARGGGIVRGFAWTGQTIWNEGDLTPAERTFRMRCPAYDEPSQDNAISQDSILANIDKVPLLAARWSVDPVSVHQQIPHAIGVTGEFPRIRTS